MQKKILSVSNKDDCTCTFFRGFRWSLQSFSSWLCCSSKCLSLWVSFSSSRWHFSFWNEKRKKLVSDRGACMVLIRCCRPGWVELYRTETGVQQTFTCSCCSSLMLLSHSPTLSLIWFSCFCCWWSLSAFCRFSSCWENYNETKNEVLNNGLNASVSCEEQLVPVWSSLCPLTSCPSSWCGGSSWTWPCGSWPRCAGS